MRASDLYPREYKNFQEIPEEALHHMDGDFLRKLQGFRSTTGIPLIVSPSPGAIFRTDHKSETSRHYAVGRLADAIDVFPRQGEGMRVFLYAIQFPSFGGVGVYTDTQLNDKPRMMVHLDARPIKYGSKAVWVRHNGVYHGHTSASFWSILSKAHKKLDKY
jgi:hypothetical protein